MADIEIGKLKTTLEANATGFVTQMKKAAQVLDEVEEQAGKTGDAVEAAAENANRGANKMASGFNGLNYQIQMFARELPTLALSPQMFILAISNNLPMLADEISNVSARNKELADSGKSVVSTFSQLLKGVMNWQTLLVVGITVLTMYGDEIADWAKSLFSSGDAINYATDAQKEFSNALQQGVRDAQGEVVRLNLLRRAAESENLSRAERLDAVKALKSEFPQHLKNLSDEAILQGKVAGAYKDAATAIVAKAQASALTNKITNNANKILDFNDATDGLGLQDAYNQYNELYSNTKDIPAMSKGERVKIEIGGELVEFDYLTIKSKVKSAQYQIEDTLDNLKKNLKKEAGKDDEKINWINEIFAPFDDNDLPFDKQLSKFLSYSNDLSKINDKAANEIVDLMSKFQEAGSVGEHIGAQYYIDKGLDSMRADNTTKPLIIPVELSESDLSQLQKEMDDIANTPLYQSDTFGYYSEQIKAITAQMQNLKGAELEAALAQKQRLEIQQALAGGDYTGGLNLQNASLLELQTLWDNADESAKAYLATLLKIGEGGSVDGMKEQIGDWGDIWTTGITSFSQQLGEALKDGAISGDELKEMFITPVAQMAQQLGSLLIAAGVAESALFSGNPVAMIAGGAALLAIGTALSAAMSNLHNSSTAASSAGTTDTFTGGYGNGTPSSIWGETRSIDVYVTGKLEGQDIALATERYNKYNNR